MGSRSSAAASARPSSSTFVRFKWPKKWVNIDFGGLANSSDSIPTMTWVRKPLYREYTGAQTTDDNFESIKTWRLTTTNTRCLRGSLVESALRSGVPRLVTRNKSPRCTYLVNLFGTPWVAQNKTVPLEVLDVLARDSDPAVRLMVAMKNKLSYELLSLLASDSDDGVRQRISRNKKTPRDVLEQLSRDANSLVSASASERLIELEEF